MADGKITEQELSTELQTTLNSKAPLASPTFTGSPTLSGVGRLIADSASSGTDIYCIWSGTQAQYNAIGSKDANTLYVIV